MGEGNKNLQFRGKAITLTSENGPENCIIDCERNGRGVHFNAAETSATILKDITIRNGCVFTPEGGGGILCNSSPTIDGCIITNCVADLIRCQYAGGGIKLEYSSAIIKNCFVTNNFAQAGGGIMVKDSDAVIYNCYVSYNRTYFGKGGILVASSDVEITDSSINNNDTGGIEFVFSTANIVNCLISNNSGWSGISVGRDSEIHFEFCTGTGNVSSGDGGGVWISGSNILVTLRNCIIWGNSAAAGNEIFMKGYDPLPYLIISHSTVGNAQNDIIVEDDCLIEWQPGCVFSDPLFMSGPVGNYYLSQTVAGQPEDSACVNSGYGMSSDMFFYTPDGMIPMSTMTTRTDLDFDIGIVDMGFHYQPDAVPTATPTATVTPNPTLTPSSTPAPTLTPTPITTPTTTPAPTYTPYPTPECDVQGVDIIMPATEFRPGDTCYCDIYVCNPGATTYFNTPLFVILDMFGNLFFAPGFTGFDFLEIDVSPGVSVIEILPDFQWPVGAGNASGVFWYAGMTNPEMNALVGEYDIFEFSWSE